MSKYLYVEKLTDFPVWEPVALAADNGFDAHEEAFARFVSWKPEKVEFAKLFELTDDGEIVRRAKFTHELDPTLNVLEGEVLV